MDKPFDLKTKIIDQLDKSRKHLNFSFNKVKNFNFSTIDFSQDDEKLETLESFSSRFSRYSDLVISKYFRILAKEKDPAFQGSVIDLLNLAEKWGWIDSSRTWKRIREIRNLAAHEYNLEDYLSLYKEIFVLSSELLKVKLDL